MRIRRLSEGTVNRIAAGEVIERPASVVKELAENAIDAGSRQIDVAFRGGGRTLIRVVDDGHGMAADDLALSIERHATSKLNDDDLFDIKSLGFRGEALPSIGAVSRMTIASRPAGGEAMALTVEGGAIAPLRPAALTRGTEVDVRDLFYATPARLKFLKAERTETAEAADVLRRLALAHPDRGFSFATEERRIIDVPAGETLEARMGRVLGQDFIENSVPFEAGREDLVVSGRAGLPTWSRATGASQFMFVNGRPVRDKLLAGAIRGAYADVMPRGRVPAVVLFVTCDASRVDVNVHPAKAEVRFRDGGLVRGLVVNALKAAIAARSQKADAGLSKGTLDSFRREWQAPPPPGLAETQAALAMDMPLAARAAPADDQPTNYPLGAARAQIHDNYIVAQTAEGFVLVDQHAAHERLVYERLKTAWAEKRLATQPLLVPEVVDLEASAVERLASAAELLAQSGLVLEPFGEGAVIVREVPQALAGGDIAGLVRDVADELSAEDESASVDTRINHLLATMACHHSVRSGRTLRPEEMNALLREMEATPNSGTCNHGRPTFIELKLADIERLFGRR